MGSESRFWLLPVKIYQSQLSLGMSRLTKLYFAVFTFTTTSALRLELLIIASHCRSLFQTFPLKHTCGGKNGTTLELVVVVVALLPPVFHFISKHNRPQLIWSGIHAFFLPGRPNVCPIGIGTNSDQSDKPWLILKQLTVLFRGQWVSAGVFHLKHWKMIILSKVGLAERYTKKLLTVQDPLTHKDTIGGGGGPSTAHTPLIFLFSQVPRNFEK